MRSLNFFVPIDFSKASYNALQYATLLAKESEGNVKLCHVIDLEELPESDNQILASLALDRIIKEAEKKLRSLREFITLDAINTDEDILIGNVAWSLINKIEKVKPDVIVIGRSNSQFYSKGSITHQLTHNTKTPVLVIPQAHRPRVPSRALLHTNIEMSEFVTFNSLLGIVKKLSPEISILNAGGEENKVSVNLLNDLRDKHGINASFLYQSNFDEYVKKNGIDILYKVNRKQNLFQRLFGPKREDVRSEDYLDLPSLEFNF